MTNQPRESGVADRPGAQDAHGEYLKWEASVGYVSIEQAFTAGWNAALDAAAIKADNGDYRDLTAHETADVILALKGQP